MVKVFIDNSGWYGIVNSQAEYHNQAKKYFQHLLDSRAKLYTNVLEVNKAIDQINRNCSPSLAQEFSKLIEESTLTTNIHMIWLTRRLRRSSLKQFFSMREPGIELSHCIIFEEMQRKKVNAIFSFDDILKVFGIPLMPQV